MSSVTQDTPSTKIPSYATSDAPDTGPAPGQTVAQWIIDRTMACLLGSLNSGFAPLLPLDDERQATIVLETLRALKASIAKHAPELDAVVP